MALTLRNMEGLVWPGAFLRFDRAARAMGRETGGALEPADKRASGGRPAFPRRHVVTNVAVSVAKRMENAPSRIIIHLRRGA
jgi:hypothetical protein